MRTTGLEGVIFMDGYMSFEEGLSRSDLPMPATDWARRVWLAGWNEAATEVAIAVSEAANVVMLGNSRQPRSSDSSGS